MSPLKPRSGTLHLVVLLADTRGLRFRSLDLEPQRIAPMSHRLGADRLPYRHTLFAELHPVITTDRR